MKQKTAIITLAILVAVLILGIAYAAITAQQLQVTGSASVTVSDANFDVKFTGAVPSGDVAPAVEINADDDQKATMVVSGLTTAGQKAVGTFTIENASPADVIANLEAKVTHLNSDWFDVTATIGDTTATTAKLGKTETTTLIVTVTLLQTPATDKDVEDAVDTITVTVDATAE